MNDINSCVSELAVKLGYSFKNITLLKEALTHPHGNNKSDDEYIRDYQRLEFLGDKIINFIVADILYKQFSQADEGYLSVLHSLLVRKSTLANLALKLGLDVFIIFNNGDSIKDPNLRKNSSILENVCEAIFGAILCDSNYSTVYEIVEKLWHPMIVDIVKSSDLDNNNIEKLKDPKSKLQEWCQQNKYAIPKYIDISRLGSEHEPVFKVAVCIKFFCAFGVGKSKKIARQDASMNALNLLNF